MNNLTEFSSDQLKSLLSIAIEASLDAGEKIVEVYNSDFAVEHKEDKSPLTEADQQGHNIIVSYLEKTNLPILSEEGAEIPYSERKNWNYSWTVDPLDGTKEFVKRNGEFTVNIALIHNQKAIGGVIFVPVKNWLYFGLVGIGAYKIEGKITASNFEELVNIAIQLPATSSSDCYKVVGSRSHTSVETSDFIKELEKTHPSIEIVSMGSSLKICLVAEGVADVYPRFAPTMEWDTAAGQAIAIAAGKNIIDYTTKKTMLYNRENLLNNWFIVE